MSEVIVGLLKLTFGVVRTFATKELQDGDLTDEKVRGAIVQKLNKIEAKIDASNRKELSASESSLRQGIQHLIMSCDDPSTSESLSTSELQNQPNHSQDTLTTYLGETSIKTKLTQTSPEDAFGLADAVQKLDVASKDRLKSSKKLLEEAEKTARLAFHNTGLSTEDRILASEIRIASAILKLLDDPELAVSDCLQYLTELHGMPAIKEIFSVENKLGTKSWLKSNFYKESRAKIVKRITSINLIVAGFISKFTEKRMAVLDWPMIECGIRLVHPIHSGCQLTDLSQKLDIYPPWDIENNDLEENEALPFTHVLKREYLNRVCYERCSLGYQVTLDKTIGKLQPYCCTKRSSYSEPDYKDFNFESIIDVAVHEDGTAYTLRGFRVDGNVSFYILSSYRANSCCHSLLHISCSWIDSAIAVTRNKNVVICQFSFNDSEMFNIYICDSFGEVARSFAFNTSSTNDDHYKLQFVSVSRDDEVIVAAKTDHLLLRNSYVVRFFTEEGEIQRTVKFRPIEQPEHSWRITYNKVAKSFIVFGTQRVSDIFLQYFSDRTGELQRSYVLTIAKMPKEMSNYAHDPVCHPNGALALAVSQTHYHFFEYAVPAERHVISTSQQ